ncbi:MAG: hypothetical protein ACRD7E_18390, partial [Bryobacteraceae bacterium]
MRDHKALRGSPIRTGDHDVNVENRIREVFDRCIVKHRDNAVVVDGVLSRPTQTEPVTVATAFRADNAVACSVPGFQHSHIPTYCSYQLHDFRISLSSGILTATYVGSANLPPTQMPTVVLGNSIGVKPG